LVGFQVETDTIYYFLHSHRISPGFNRECSTKGIVDEIRTYVGVYALGRTSETFRAASSVGYTERRKETNILS